MYTYHAGKSRVHIMHNGTVLCGAKVSPNAIADPPQTSICLRCHHKYLQAIDPLLSKSALIKRGWSETLIRKYLTPDQEVPNPHYSSGPKVKLYRTSTVQKAEGRKDIREALARIRRSRDKRSKAAKQAAQRRKEELLRYINSIEIKVETLPEDVLFKRAVEHYNALWASRDKWEKHITLQEAQQNWSFLRRISRNYLRHTAQYHEELERLFGKTGASEAYELLRDRIERAIDDSYPYLRYKQQSKEERCLSQKSST